jgi:hypothetical protein
MVNPMTIPQITISSKGTITSDRKDTRNIIEILNPLIETTIDLEEKVKVGKVLKTIEAKEMNITKGTINMTETKNILKTLTSTKIMCPSTKTIKNTFMPKVNPKILKK